MVSLRRVRRRKVAEYVWYTRYPWSKGYPWSTRYMRSKRYVRYLSVPEVLTDPVFVDLDHVDHMDHMDHKPFAK
jgi:hypothetical protein